MNHPRFILAVCCAVVLRIASIPHACGQLSVDDRSRLTWPDGASVQIHRRPAGPAPVTVASPEDSLVEEYLPLDKAIQLALQHSEVIRVLTGTSAASGGRTIYDTAIATTPIDIAVSRFDPVFQANTTWRQTESVGAVSDPADPTGLSFLAGGSQAEQFDISAGLSRTNRIGGAGSVTFSQPSLQGRGADILGSARRPRIDLSYTQPLLLGAGRAVNEAPIVIAELEAGRSYFQFKDSVQELVRGVISAYWSLVEARTTLWAREKQVEQAQEALDRVEAQLRVRLADLGDVAQPRVAYANFKANLVVARANVIQREAALRNLIGLPPEDGRRLVPSTPPTRDRIEFDWDDLVASAQQKRPDLVELSLVLLADNQRLIQDNNLARPSLNAVTGLSWNGLHGRMLNGATLSSHLHDNPSWSIGVAFSVPLSLRQGRAAARTRELQIARTRAGIRQALHAAEHTLATDVRSLDQFYAQYEAFRETRSAARLNLQVQQAEERADRAIFLNVLQAITDWGNAVASEATSLTQYNTALATLEADTGTILDTHAVVFVEEQFQAVGPFGRHSEPGSYPRALRPRRDSVRYGDSDEAAEESFGLNDFRDDQD